MKAQQNLTVIQAQALEEYKMLAEEYKGQLKAARRVILGPLPYYPVLTAVADDQKRSIAALTKSSIAVASKAYAKAMELGCFIAGGGNA